MTNPSIQAPIAYIVFNRPQHVRQTFAAIRAQRPTKLLIIADGPRAGHPTDAQRCHEVREILSNIDWPCEVLRNYSEVNLGCKLRVSSGLDWVFEQVETAIILEDDCIPHVDFFPFCDVLLERYAADMRVWVITGNNFQHGKKHGDASYYFSKFNHVWGWATWRRAWQHYRVDMPFWPEWKSTLDWQKKLSDPVERTVWAGLFDRVKRGEIDTWDYQWTACVWYHGGLTATPNVNLVTNIGFGPDATHTIAAGDEAGLPIYPLGVLKHPSDVKQNRAADRHVFNHNFGGLYHPDRLRSRLLKRRDQFLRSPQWVIKKIRQFLSRQA